MLAIVVAGCSSSRELYLPPEEPSINTGVDTFQLETIPPAPPPGAPTSPVEVRLYDSTRAPASSFSRISVSDEAVNLLLPSGTMLEFVPERFGETLVIEATEDSVQATVAGEPEAEKRNVTEQELQAARPWWDVWANKVQSNLAVIGALAVLVVVGFFAFRLLNPLSWL